MKLSISIPDEDVQVLDAYARDSGLRSRSASVHAAVQLLRQRDLEVDYARAWDEWETSGQAKKWDATSADGIDDAAR